MEVQEQAEEQVQQQVEEVKPSGLPSDVAEQEAKSVSFEINPDDLQDGKFGGKWESPKQMADHIKEMEDKYANLQRDVKNQSKQTEQEIAETATEVQKQQLKQDTVQKLAPEFLNNGMQLTEDMKTELMDAGLTEQEIKLGAYELKEAVDKNASYVGGKENYDIIMDYHAQNMSDEDKIAFNHSIQDPRNSKALMIGLQAMYEQSIANEVPNTDRVRGVQANGASVKPYETKQELLRDKAYADSRAASASDKARFRARLNITPENVWLS